MEITVCRRLASKQISECIFLIPVNMKLSFAHYVCIIAIRVGNAVEYLTLESGNIFTTKTHTFATFETPNARCYFNAIVHIPVYLCFHVT